jgi:NAD(P)-dependent dehydrogenase (short-subunit alcohol dehydrogenase family)
MESVAKTAVVTGGTDGIGRITALRLAELGYQVIITGRSAEKCKAVNNEIKSRTGNDMIRNLCVDFTDREQIKKAGEFLTCYINKVDVVIDNAGTFENSYSLVEGKYEKTFFVNHLAHFYFNTFVFDLMMQSPDPRVVVVSSMAHASGLPLEIINDKNHFDPYSAYSWSKLANILYTFKLAGLLKDRGITANCLHPGVINTKLLKAGWGPVGAPVETGADTSVFLATSEKVRGVTGKYFSNMREKTPAKAAFDIDLQNRLWEYSEEVFGLG